VRDGRSLSEALADHPRVFPPLYRSLVRAGETGGGLEQALNRLAELGEHEAELRSRLLSASAYPLFVLSVAMLMSVFLLMYVIPKLSLVFLETGQLLPLPTRFLLGVSQLVLHWWGALILGLVLLVWGIRRWYASPAGKALIDRQLIAVPAVGTFVRKLETARLARNLGTLVSQGVPMLQALDVVADNVSNATLRLAVQEIRTAVRDGSSLAGAVTATGRFPVFVANMVAVGEESGTVDAALLKVASAYEREVNRTLQDATTILEPVLLVAVGGVVMFIVLAMLLPVFQIGLVVQ
jgi:general secretion pathway protein F